MAKKNSANPYSALVGPILLPIGVLAPIGMILGISGALVQSYMIARFPFLGNETVNALLVSIRSIAGSCLIISHCYLLWVWLMV